MSSRAGSGTFRIACRAPGVRGPHDDRPNFMEKTGGMEPDGPETLDRHPGAFQAEVAEIRRDFRSMPQSPAGRGAEKRAAAGETLFYFR